VKCVINRTFEKYGCSDMTRRSERNLATASYDRTDLYHFQTHIFTRFMFEYDWLISIDMLVLLGQIYSQRLYLFICNMFRNYLGWDILV
jgi:hypothetical protein